MAVSISPDQVLRGGVESGEVPGIVALAANESGVVYEGAYGKRELGGSADMTVDSVFWIASQTKAITTVAAMQLVEQGKLGLDTPAGEVVSELAAPQVLDGFEPDGSPRLRPATRPITLRHLLTHTAGHVYDIWNADMLRYQEVQGIPNIIECRRVTLANPLAFDPGARWEYGIGIDWAGQMVERASGQHLEDYFREHIFTPLGMKDTSFKLSPSQRSRLASMHARGSDGSLTPIAFEVPQEPEFFMGGGGLYSSGPDYLRFERMLLGRGTLEGSQVLRPETVDAMFENHIGELTVGLLQTAIPRSSNDAEFFPGLLKRWGLGFMINVDEAPTGRSGGSLAWAGLGNTYYWIDPTKRVVGIILTQILPFADESVLRLFSDFESAIYASSAG